MYTCYNLLINLNHVNEKTTKHKTIILFNIIYRFYIAMPNKNE